MFRVFIVAGLLGLLSACAENIPPLNFSIPDVGPTTAKIDAEVKAVTVTIASDSEKTGDLSPGTGGAIPLWKDSLEDAFNRMAIFKDDAPRKIAVSVVILQFHVPYKGIRLESIVTAKYELIDRANGAIIYTQTVTTKGRTALDWGTSPPLARSRDSLNRAVQANITQFLQALPAADINKPMVPAKSG